MPLSETVQPTEPLARFLWARKQKQYDPDSGIIFWDAFEPHPADRKTSVYRTLDLSEPEIWAIGHRISTRPKPPLGGRADVSAETIVTVGLVVEPDPIPERHSNITGWPQELEHMISLAQELAAASSLVLDPGV